MNNEISEAIEVIIEILFTVRKANNFLELDYWEWELEQHMKLIE